MSNNLSVSALRLLGPLWLLGALSSVSCTLSPGVDLPGEKDPGDDGGINTGDGDGDSAPSSGGTGSGGDCPLGGAGGQNGSEAPSESDRVNSRALPSQGGEQQTLNCLLK